MTTIAWDGKTMAGDTYVERAGYACSVPTKVFRLERGLLGVAGDEAQALLLRDWLSDPEMDTPKRDELNDVCGLWIKNNGEVMYLRDRNVWVPYERRGSPYIAIGSGQDFAFSAMVGWQANAVAAVKFACEWCVSSKGPITYTSLSMRNHDVYRIA